MNLKEFAASELAGIQEKGLYKDERVLTSPQQAHIETRKSRFLNFCANNYLGLANHPELLAAGKEALDRYGFGMASVRFICGTAEIHKQLEERVARFLGYEDVILYSSCFDANTGLFETLLDEQDAIISDRLNHASIIDGTRLCKAMRFRFRHGNMEHLETQLKRADKYRFRMIATDGVFSMDGDVARLKEICDLGERYDALVMVDDSHATGFFGPTGRGSVEHHFILSQHFIPYNSVDFTVGGIFQVADIHGQRVHAFAFNAGPAKMLHLHRLALKCIVLLRFAGLKAFDIPGVHYHHGRARIQDKTAGISVYGSVNQDQPVDEFERDLLQIAGLGARRYRISNQ